MVDNKKIRVLHFGGGGGIGGQEKAMYQLFKSFINDKEFDFGAAMGKSDTLFYSQKLKELHIPVIELGFKGGTSFKINKKILVELKKFNIHHFHDPTPNLILLSLLSGSGIKRAFTRRGGFHNYRNKGLKIRLKYFINRILVKNFFHGYSGNTKLAVEFVKQYYGIRDKEIYVLYNGIDFSHLMPNMNKENVIHLLSLSNEEFKIGTACHLIDLKRVDLIIRAFAVADINKKKLLIFGKGNEEAYLKKLVKDLQLERDVIFCGEVTHIADYLQILDCFILASGREESFGNAVVEAMYFKIPSIIMNDSDGLKEHISDNQTGFIAKDEFDISNKFEFVFNHRALCEEIAEKASLYVYKKYSIQNMKHAYKNFYFDILHR